MSQKTLTEISNYIYIHAMMSHEDDSRNFHDSYEKTFFLISGLIFANLYLLFLFPPLKETIRT